MHSDAYRLIVKAGNTTMLGNAQNGESKRYREYLKLGQGVASEPGFGAEADDWQGPANGSTKGPANGNTNVKHR